MQKVTEETNQFMWNAVHALRTGNPSKQTVDILLHSISDGIEQGGPQDAVAVDVLKELSQALWGRQWNDAAFTLEKMLTADATKGKEVVEYRRFAPGVQFVGSVLPAEELAALLQGWMSEDLPTGVEATTFAPPNGESGVVVAWPMLADDYIRWGWSLMERLHDVCMGNTAEEGNEFMGMYDPKDKDWQIGGAMYPVLCVADAERSPWRDHKGFAFRKPKSQAN